MKKTKFLKVLAPIVALGLLIGALVGVSASANETAPASDVTPEIISMNVEYGSELYLYYAVDKATVTEAPVLEVLDAEGKVIATVADYSEATIWGGTAVYVFKAPGIAPKDIGIMQNVRVVSGEAVSAVKSASIEGYLYAKLYKEGYIAKADDAGKDYTRRNLYLQLLKYARAAQEIFSAPGFVPVGGAGLCIEGAEGLVSGKYTGDAEYLALNAANKEGFSYWDVQLVDAKGKVVDTMLVADGYEVYLGGNSLIASPVYDVEAPEGVLPWDKAVHYFNYLPASGYTISTGNEAEAAYVKGENTWGIKTLEDGNKVLHIHKNCNGSLNPGYNDANKTYNWGVSSVIGVTEKQENANVAIFEAKICYLNLSASAEAEISIRSTSTDKKNVPVKYYINASRSAGSQFVVKPQTNGASESDVTLTGAKVGSWFTLRIEYRTTEEGLEHKLFINDSLVYTGTNIYGTNIVSGSTAIPKASDLVSVAFLVNNSVMGDVYFDDVSFKLLCE